MKKIIAIAMTVLIGTTIVSSSFAQAEEDLILFRADWGAWYGNVSSNGFGDLSQTTSLAGYGAPWGPPWVFPLVGDVNGDGLDDMVVVQDPEQDGGAWSWNAAHSVDTNNDGVIEMSSTLGTPPSSAAGWAPVDETLLVTIADITGDGIQDALFLSTNFWWVVKESTTNGIAQGDVQPDGVILGTQTLNDQPIIGDFNGDGMDDIGVWRQDTGNTFVLLTGGTIGSGIMGTGNGGTNVVGVFGESEWDVALVGDINGDGRDDLMLVETNTTANLAWQAAFGQANGMLSTNEVSNITLFGLNSDMPMLADVNGDGMDDLIAVRTDPGTGAMEYYAAFTETGGVLTPEDDSSVGWGNATLGDIPLFGQLNTEVLPPPEIGDIAVANLATGLQLTWTTGVGYDYQLQIKTNLMDVSWVSNATYSAMGNSLTVTTAVDEAQSFYRVIVE